MQKHSSKNHFHAVTLVILNIVMLFLISNCSLESWPDRPDRRVNKIPVSSVNTYPANQIYVPAGDSLKLELKIALGDECAKVESILFIQADSASSWIPGVTAIIPGIPNCAQQTKARDTLVNTNVTLRSGKKIQVRGTTPDSKNITLIPVIGRFIRDSIRYEKTLSVSGAADNGIFTFYDSSSFRNAQVRADSLEAYSCLSHATLHRIKDTAWVRFTWVEIDTAATIKSDLCSDKKHTDSVFVSAAQGSDTLRWAKTK